MLRIRSPFLSLAPCRPRALEHCRSSSSLGKVEVPGARHPCWQLALGLGHFYDHVQQLSCQYSHWRVFAQARVKAHDECHVVVWFAHAAEIPGDAALDRLVEQRIPHTFLFVVKFCPHLVDFTLHLCPQPLSRTFARNHVIKI